MGSRVALRRTDEARADGHLQRGTGRGQSTRPCCAPVTPARATPAELARWARIFRALADPTRLGILALLQAQQEPLCVCDIVAQFPQGQPTISHHLKVLRDAGLVTAERRGPWVYYAPAAPGLMEAWRAIGRLMP
ncbi:MAG TPA: metalloregulator ArsR/SmtB family transcription factor [Limnochordales bacterium]